MIRVTKLGSSRVWLRSSLLCFDLSCPRTMAVDTTGIHANEIRNRPPGTWRHMALTICYFLVFDLAFLTIHACQFVFILPLRFLPFASAKSLYHAGIRLSEGACGTLLRKCSAPCRWLRSSGLTWSSSPLSIVRTFASGRHARTRWPWRVPDGRDP